MNLYQQITQQLLLLDRENQLKLSGFLEALLLNSEISTPTALSSPSATTDDNRITIAFASQTGNSETIAKQLADLLQHQGYLADTINVADIQLKKMSHWQFLIIVASTHGEGEPPDTAITFSQQFATKRAPDLSHLKYAVIALGDQSYEQFCEFGKWLDQRLSELKAEPLIDRLDCDVDYDEDIQQWSKELLEAIKHHGSKQQPTIDIATSPNTPLINSKNPLATEVINSINLCTEQVDKQVYHLELDAPELAYTPGDSLGVIVKNPTDLVNRIIQHTGLSATEQINFAKDNWQLIDCLSNRAELFRLTVRQLKRFIQDFPNTQLSKILADDKSAQDYVFNHDWLSILEQYPTKFITSAQQFADYLLPQVLRLYSISSSPKAHEEEVHLTVRLREFGDQHRKGLVTGCISALSAGDKLDVFVKPNNNFRLPADDKPIIMIASGTGVAPFRSFMFERQELGINTPSWLFFGEQSFRNSFLYQTDWLKFLKNNELSELTTAFSRDGEQKIYIQQRLIEHGAKLYDWLQQGAIIYVCGSADTMAADVHHALSQILQTHGKLNEQQANHKLQEMLTQGSYKRDVY